MSWNFSSSKMELDRAKIEEALNERLPGSDYVSLDEGALLVVLVPDGFTPEDLKEFQIWQKGYFKQHQIKQHIMLLPKRVGLALAKTLRGEPREAVHVLYDGAGSVLGAYSTEANALEVLAWYSTLVGTVDYNAVKLNVDEPVPAKEHWPAIKAAWLPKDKRRTT